MRQKRVNDDDSEHSKRVRKTASEPRLLVEEEKSVVDNEEELKRLRREKATLAR